MQEALGSLLSAEVKTGKNTAGAEDWLGDKNPREKLESGLNLDYQCSAGRTQRTRPALSRGMDTCPFQFRSSSLGDVHTHSFIPSVDACPAFCV